MSADNIQHLEYTRLLADALGGINTGQPAGLPLQGHSQRAAHQPQPPDGNPRLLQAGGKPRFFKSGKNIVTFHVSSPVVS
ncbi:hypothetical protein SDC9_183726 [bioreactor metagenome]|uniref:Uncharacterized protein n=1 Tax=bioreactor metagenome TaxID=1076179 RepID=A0A645HB13_9ZZZZ